MNDVIKLPLEEEILQIGYGRLGKPFYKYLSSVLGYSPSIIKSSDDKNFKLKKFKYIFVCTDDLSLKPIINKWQSYSEKIIHFSGSLYFKNTLGVHPVYSFPVDDKAVIDFTDIDFVIDEEISDSFLKSLFKKTALINPSKKSQYHLHLSLMANYAQLLTYEMKSSFKEEVGIGDKYFFKILKQSIDSVEKSGEKSFSGPWVRDERAAQIEQALNHKNEVIRNLNESFDKLIKVYKKRREESYEHP